MSANPLAGPGWLQMEEDHDMSRAVWIEELPVVFTEAPDTTWLVMAGGLEHDLYFCVHILIIIHIYIYIYVYIYI